MDIKESSGYKDFVWAIELHRFGLKVIGLWPKTGKFDKGNLWLELHAGITLILLIFVCDVPMIFSIAQDWGDMVRLINKLQSTIPFMVLSAKYAIICWKRSVLLSIVNMMEEDWMAFKLDIERDVMIKRAQIARFLMIIAYICSISGFLIMIIPPYFGKQILYVANFTDRKKRLPLQTYGFYDINKSPQFELTFIIHVIISFPVTVIYMIVDFLLVLFIFHICGQLENFRYRLNRLVSCKNFNTALNDILIRHLRLIRFADNIEDMYSLMTLTSILYFCILFCLSGFLFTVVFIDGKTSGTLTQLFFLTFVVSIILMNSFLYCAAGQLITEQCDAVYRTICDLKWYKLESKKARDLILLMIRASHPFHITAGKIIPLTMSTFCNVLKTSCGYISFLLTKHG